MPSLYSSSTTAATASNSGAATSGIAGNAKATSVIHVASAPPVTASTSTTKTGQGTPASASATASTTASALSLVATTNHSQSTSTAAAAGAAANQANQATASTDVKKTGRLGGYGLARARKSTSTSATSIVGTQSLAVKPVVAGDRTLKPTAAATTAARKASGTNTRCGATGSVLLPFTEK